MLSYHQPSFQDSEIPSFQSKSLLPHYFLLAADRRHSTDYPTTLDGASTFAFRVHVALDEDKVEEDKVEDAGSNAL